MKNRSLTILSILFLVSIGLVAQEKSLCLKNQFNLWSAANFQAPLIYQVGGRYMPELSFEKYFEKERMFDVELSFNAYANADFTGWDRDTAFAKLKPYRAWVRYSGSNFEVRAGLQKIDFGSASMLRPLMWFDQIDPRDPLRLTAGVYGLLGRYYFNNNTNIWLWGLIGNDDPKGWDATPTITSKPEFGGRVQLPIGTGELAISFNHRMADNTSLNNDTTLKGEISEPENKLGLDGKWDIGVGIWYEAVFKHNGQYNSCLTTWGDYLNFGVDYTFGFGNGLNAVAEFFRVNASDLLLGQGTRMHFSAISASYPVGVMDNISGIMYINLDNGDWYRFVNYSRQYDYWTFYLMAFWNPDEYALYNFNAERNLYAGKGVQFMAVINF